MIYEASLDTLTDGSELTEPAIFLTIRRCSKGTNLDSVELCGDDSKHQSGIEEEEDIFYTSCAQTDSDGGTIVARYNLTGLPSLTGRLSADQSFKLLQGGAFSAVLIPSLVTSYHDGNYGMRCASLGGLPALFLSLIQSGYKVAQSSMLGGDDIGSDSAPENDWDNNVRRYNNNTRTAGGYDSVSIVGPPGIEATVDGILDTMFGNVRKRPSIRICEVPVESNDWWEVYQDSYVKIWAQAVSHSSCVSYKCEACSEIVHEESSSSEGESSDDDGDGAEEVYVESDDSSSSSSRAEKDDTVRSSQHPTGGVEHSIVYIVMLRSQNTGGISPTLESRRGQGSFSSLSFAIIPPTPFSPQNKKCHECGVELNKRSAAHAAPIWNTLRTLPQDVIANKRKCTPLLDFILHLDPWIDTNEEYNYNNHRKAEQTIHNEPLGKRRRTEPSKNDSKHFRMRVPKHHIVIPSTVVANCHMATVPKSNHFVEGILIRAQQRSKLLHKFLPFAFPISTHNLDESCSKQFNEKPQKSNMNVNKSDPVHTKAFGLKPGTSVILHRWGIGSISKEVGLKRAFTFVSRIEKICNRCEDSSNVCSSPSTNHARSVKCAFAGNVCFCGVCKHAATNDEAKCADYNEIDLESCSSESENDADNLQGLSDVDGKSSNGIAAEGTGPQNEKAIDMNSPHILMLGTGCATPSPTRGSSAYGLIFPTTLNGDETLVLSAIIECGEGTMTSLQRHLPTFSRDLGSINSHLRIRLSHVNFVWISHSHLDHYADLPIVVQAIACAKRKSSNDAQQPNQLVVIAPSKVLKYLNIMLGQKTAMPTSRVIESSQQPPYVGVTHREFQHSPFASHLRSCIYNYTLPLRGISQNGCYNPFASLRHAEVEHCREAFAIILHMNIPCKSSSHVETQSISVSDFVLCFSGDTRPSIRLVQACRQTQQRVSLLLHEATFLHDSQGRTDAAKKRHSTTHEALDIAQQINSEVCILTHFSQRYKHISLKDICDGKNSFPFSWGIALDGIMVPLTKRALSSIFILSQCIDDIMDSKKD